MGAGHREFESRHPDVSSTITSHAQLHQICERDDWRCRYCGRQLFCGTCEPARARSQGKAIWATRDHIIPRSRGGTGAAWNLAACCPPCNRNKADKLPADYTPPKVSLKKIPAPQRRPRYVLTQRITLPSRILERVHSLDCWVMTFIALNPGRPIEEGPPCNCDAANAA